MSVHRARARLRRQGQARRGALAELTGESCANIDRFITGLIMTELDFRAGAFQEERWLLLGSGVVRSGPWLGAEDGWHEGGNGSS